MYFSMHEIFETRMIVIGRVSASVFYEYLTIDFLQQIDRAPDYAADIKVSFQPRHYVK